MQQATTVGYTTPATLSAIGVGVFVGDRVGALADDQEEEKWLHCRRSVLAIAAVFRLLFTFNFLFRLENNQSF